MNKKLVSIIFIAVLALSALGLVACGSSSSSTYVGTWTFSSMKLGDYEITGDQLLSSDYNAEDFMQLTLNADGSATITSALASSTVSGKWSESSTGITITDDSGTALDCTYENGKMVVQSEDYTFYLQKK